MNPEQKIAFLPQLEEFNDQVVRELDGIANYNFLTPAPAMLTPVDRNKQGE